MNDAPAQHAPTQHTPTQQEGGGRADATAARMTPVGRAQSSLSDGATPVITLDDLSVRFGRHQVLRGLSATVGGRCIGLLGPNGAGKTTLLNTLLGFYRPSGGSAQIFGNDVVAQNKAVRQVVGYMPERDSFIAGMTAVRFVRMMAELSGLKSSDALERAHEVLFYVGLGEARYRTLETYSLGMKQLAKLAQAIVHGPRLLFLDEPTNGLDPPARARMLQLINEIRDNNDAHIVISSHLLRDVEACCEEVLVLNEGRIATYCNLDEERRSNRRFLLMEVKGDETRFVAGMREMGCEVGAPNRRRLRVVLPEHVTVEDVYTLARSLSVQLRKLDYKRDSLEDIFLRAMDGESTEDVAGPTGDAT